jgi:hypothetical protein
MGGVWSIYSSFIAIVNQISSNQAVIKGLNPGIDTVYYQDSNGCKALGIVMVDTLPKIIISGVHEICYGECAKLAITPVAHATYLWEHNTGISCTDCDTILACPRETQLYTVVVTNGNHCEDSTYFSLVVHPLPHLDYTPKPFYMCNGSTKQIMVRDTIASNNTNTFSWYPNDSISNLHVPNPVFSDIIDLVYTVVGTSQYGCKDSIRIPVSVLDSANTAITPDTVICIGNHHVVSVLSTDPNSTYQWYIVSDGVFLPATSLSDPTSWAPL